MNLVIVESPSKTKTIKQYLGDDYEVVASKGHIRDIENTGIDNLGIDIKNDYKPIYCIISRQYSTIKSLNTLVNKADKIYLATDPDREGEAISWHLKEVLDIKDKPIKRIEFNEITEPAVLNAIKNPRDIDMNLFESQETRKIIDRIIGYKLSQLLKRTVGGEDSESSVSAGRVQSAALKLIIDREEKIKNFTPVKYFEIESTFPSFKAKLTEENKQSAWQIKNEDEANDILNNLGKEYIVKNIQTTTRYDKSFPPFTTSTLLQAALTKYSLNSKKTLKIAQELYEGIEIGSRHVALITYMRTDSTRLSDTFINQLKGFIKKNYGDEYLGYLHQKKKNENDQDAHEAIRPVSLYNKPDDMKEHLSKEQYQIYSLIYYQALESMMKDSEVEVKTVTLLNNGYKFVASFDKTIFDGYKVNRKQDLKDELFDYNVDDVIQSKKQPELLKKETKGPDRYTEATLIKEMESSGIGRPSTYSSTLETLKSRNYIEVSKKSLVPTIQGNLVSRFLSDYFSELIDIDYTARMEKTLDEIALGNTSEKEVVPNFYEGFINLYNSRRSNIQSMETGEVCPICGSKMVYKTSPKTGRFEACSNYPNCTYIKHQEQKEIEIIPCPDCGTGHLVQRRSKAGKKFYGCTNYPNCTFTTNSLHYVKKK